MVSWEIKVSDQAEMWAEASSARMTRVSTAMCWPRGRSRCHSQPAWSCPSNSEWQQQSPLSTGPSDGTTYRPGARWQPELPDTVSHSHASVRSGHMILHSSHLLFSFCNSHSAFPVKDNSDSLDIHQHTLKWFTWEWLPIYTYKTKPNNNDKTTRVSQV